MFRNLVIALVLFSGCSCRTFPLIPDGISRQTKETTSYRLPNSTIPISYDITLEPFFEPDFTFNGEVSILIEVVEATNTITLHGNDIDVQIVTVRRVGWPSLLILTEVGFDPTMHFITITLEEELEVGATLAVYIQYTGVLNLENTGFYRASYVENGVTKWFGTTQMEATYARQAFPCYDEPALKATFIIRIIRTAEYNSISNMALEQTIQLDDTRYRDSFEPTVIMSTYLVAFVVSEMTSISDGNQAVYAIPEFIEDGRAEYGLQSGIDILNVMEEFTGIPYSLDKMYQVSIPDDWFTFGAMENWGLVTYRDRYILYKEGLSTVSDKENVASIIAHELGHQWFGNLVSPLWWEYIWLNEGFATYFEYYATSVVEPSMRLMEQYVTIAYHRAMESDALRTTRPMTTDAQSPEEVIALFDRIAYDKSGAVIRMMEHFLTTDIFKRGLTIYLTNKQYDAAQPSDLWEGLQEAVDMLDPSIIPEPLADIMDTWSSQPGYPVVNVQRNGGEIVLSQSTFLLLEATHDLDTKWTIPINYVVASNVDFTDTKATYWLKEASENTGITVDDDEWIILNKQETGYYRINYDEVNWRLIIDYLNSTDFDQIHTLNRAQLIDDALNLARSGRLSYDVTLDLLLYLSKEADYIPLASFFRGLPFLNKHLLNTEYYESFKSFVREILQTAYESVGTQDVGEHTVKLNRINVLTWLCRFDHENCISTTHSLLSSTVPASPDLQSTVYCSGLIDDTDIEAKWTSLYERYSGDDVEYLERNRIASAFGCARSETHLTRLLDMVADKTNSFTIDNVHKTTALAMMYSSSEIGLETALEYVIENFNDLQSVLSNAQISTILSGLSDRLTTTAQRSQFQTFLNSLPDETQETFSTSFDAALSNIDANIAWSQEHLDDIADWLNQRYNNGLVLGISIPLLMAALLVHFLA